MPQGRYYHSADIVHSRQAIYIYGGLTKHVRNQLNENVLDDLWQFGLHNQRWNEIVPENKKWPPPLAGHTLTCYRSQQYDSLILIGGFSPQHGFLSTPWEFRLDKGEWTPIKTRGRGPLGLYGHSTVFHAATNSLYIFAGYHYHYNNKTVLSNRLYALRYDTMHWVDLHAFAEQSGMFPADSKLRPRFLHSAISTETYMLVFGGRGGRNDGFYAFLYNCSQWVNLMGEDVSRVGPVPGQTYAQAMTFENNSVYVVGGWGSESQCKVTRIGVPEDLCELWSGSRYKCLQMRGCGFCSAELANGNNVTHCYSLTRSIPEQCSNSNGTLRSSNGLSCEGFPSVDCSFMKECSACLQFPGCQWCRSCSNQVHKALNNCRPFSEACNFDSCPDDVVPFVSVTQCPEDAQQCLASDCYQCSQLDGCSWNRRGENDHHKTHHYQCVVSDEPGKESPLSQCETPCVNYSACAECLTIPNCHWSTVLNECISSSIQPMYCSGGVCGLVLRSDDRDHCPAPCESYTQCSTCLRHAHCGWCAVDDEKGLGICTEGSTEKPQTSCKALYQNRSTNSTNISDLTSINLTWNYVKCPPENECLNQHHSCDKDSEICVDLPDGYMCKCGKGYNTSAGGCVPECSQGCVRGVCTEPNHCRCDFGYVGANCSIECQCNGHSNCAGPDRLKECLKCHNNTMGEQCEKCKPLFVGNPVNRERCTPCFEYCNEHTHICVDENSTDPDPYPNMTLAEMQSYLRIGPAGKARCIRCGNRTVGTKCDECVPGNFRGSTDPKVSCRPYVPFPTSLFDIVMFVCFAGATVTATAICATRFTATSATVRTTPRATRRARTPTTTARKCSASNARIRTWATRPTGTSATNK